MSGQEIKQPGELMTASQFPNTGVIKLSTRDHSVPKPEKAQLSLKPSFYFRTHKLLLFKKKKKNPVPELPLWPDQIHALETARRRKEFQQALRSDLKIQLLEPLSIEISHSRVD